MTLRVALTGATGFLGRRLCRAFANAGFEVRALARRPPDSESFDHPPKWVAGDLSNDDALKRLIAGSDLAVHAAGLIKARSAREFAVVNLEGARRLALLAENRPLIHVSSLAARAPTLSDYAASKAAGERAVREVAPEAMIVRPPAIYGPGDRETLGLFRLAQGSPVMFAPAVPDARLALAEVDDVAGVILSLAERPSPGVTITVGGDRPEGYAWREIADAALSVFGRRAPIAPLPARLIMAAGRLSGILGNLRSRPPIFTNGKAREILHADWSVSAEEQGEFASFPYRPLEQGFAKAVDWYRQEGWLR